MEIDIHCADWKCPICKGQLDYKYHITDIVECMNGCYGIKKLSSWGDHFFVFGKEFKIGNSSYRKDGIKKLMDEIEYWKENDRYLIRIMSGE